MTRPAFELYKDSFPSDALLETYVGSRKRQSRKIVRFKNMALLFGGPLAVFQDVSLARAFETGLLRKSRNPLRRLRDFPYVIDKRVHARIVDVYRDVRRNIDAILRGEAMRRMRFQEDVEGLPEPVYVFKGGAFSDWVQERFKATRFSSEAAQSALCKEFVQQYHNGALHEDTWWRWQVANDTVWIEVVPDALLHKCDAERSLPTHQRVVSL